MRQLLRAGALKRPRGIGWRQRWEGGWGWGTHVNPWLIHVNVWQKPLQYCKVISLQIKINGKKSKLWYIYTMEYYSAIKNNSFQSVLMRWMKLEPIIQSEVSQKEKYQYSTLMHIYIEFRKMVKITLYARQKTRLRFIEQNFGLYGRRRGGDDLREWHQNMYIINCETDCQSRLDA